MSITLIIAVAVVAILTFAFGIIIGAKKASKEFSEKLEQAWIALNWTERDYLMLVKKFNKIK